MRSHLLAPLAILFLVAPYTCAEMRDQDRNDKNGQQVSVSVTPTEARVHVRQSQQFAAHVSGTGHTAVTWSVNGIAGGNSTVGTVSSSGFYTAPSAIPAFRITVTAHSVAHSAAWAHASVIVMHPTLVTVTISPSSVSLQQGQTQQFSAWVSGAANTEVVWLVNGVIGGGAGEGTITTNGVYYPPSSAPSAPVTVTARSVYDSASYANASIVIASHHVSLTWSASPSTVVGYNVYRSLQAGTGYARINPAPDTATDYTDGNVSPGRTYFYAVTAVESNGAETGYSNVVRATVP